MAVRRWLALVLAAGFGVAAPAGAEETLCDNPQAQCGSLLTPECVGRVGAAAVGAPEGEACDAQLRVYRNCLALVARNCGGANAGGVAAVQSAAASSVRRCRRQQL